MCVERTYIESDPPAHLDPEGEEGRELQAEERERKDHEQRIGGDAPPEPGRLDVLVVRARGELGVVDQCLRAHDHAHAEKRKLNKGLEVESHIAMET